MAKRFRDTEIWKKNFYKKLTPAYKLFWNFITDDCNHSGIWEVEDAEIITHRIGEKISLDTALFAFNEDEKRVHVFDGGKKWFIIPFVSFQYGDLNPNNRLHEAVRRELQSLDLLAVTPVRGPLERANYKDKDKDKEKEVLEDCKKPFGDEGLVMLTQEEHEKLLVKLGERKTAEYVGRLENYIGSKGKKYKSHYHTILSWTLNAVHDGRDKRQVRREKLKQELEDIDYDARGISKGNGAAVRSLPEA